LCVDISGAIRTVRAEAVKQTVYSELKAFAPKAHESRAKLILGLTLSIIYRGVQPKSQNI
jgi:hypothetical protein